MRDSFVVEEVAPGTPEQIMDQTSNGKADYTPAFKSVLKDEQIQAMAEYVKALPAS